jgi:hypothetical protein
MVAKAMASSKPPPRRQRSSRRPPAHECNHARRRVQTAEPRLEGSRRWRVRFSITAAVCVARSPVIYGEMPRAVRSLGTSGLMSVSTSEE